MKTFVQTLYDYNFTGTGTVTEEDNSDEEDEMTICMVSDSQPHGDQQLVAILIRKATRTRMSNQFLMRKMKLI